MNQEDERRTPHDANMITNRITKHREAIEKHQKEIERLQKRNPNTPNFDEFKKRLSDAVFGFESKIFTLYNALMLVHARKRTAWFKEAI